MKINVGLPRDTSEEDMTFLKEVLGGLYGIVGDNNFSRFINILRSAEIGVIEECEDEN